MGRTEQELQHASEHVKYEVEMLAATASFLSKSAGVTDQVTWNAYLESFVLHLRNLIDFYYPPERRKGLILAEHYVSDVAKWNGSRPAMTPLLQHAKRTANILAAHLTYKRLVSDKKWEWAAIWAELQRVISCFFDHLPPDRKAWFAAAESQGPTGPTGAPSPAGGAGATGPAGPLGSAGATTRE